MQINPNQQSNVGQAVSGFGIGGAGGYYGYCPHCAPKCPCCGRPYSGYYPYYPYGQITCQSHLGSAQSNPQGNIQ